MKNKNTNKGITLIALVITIIVLLILAGVSIITLTGENGIINKATLSKRETQKGGAKEKVAIEVLGSLNKYGKLSKEKLNSNLQNIKGIKGTPIEEFPATVIVDGYNIIIDENGKVTVDGKAVQDDEQFELGSEEDLKNKADKVIEGSTLTENWIKAIDIYGNEVDMANWYYESNGEGTFRLNTSYNCDNDIAGYKGAIVNNTIEGEIPAYIIKCTNGEIEEGKVNSLTHAFANIANLTKLNDSLKIPPEVNSLAGMFIGTGITEIPKNICDTINNIKYMNIMFKNCTQLTEIRPEFKLGDNAEDIRYMFEGTSIKTIPETFKLTAKINDVEGLFYKSKLQEIGNFEIKYPVWNVMNLFSGTQIKEIPDTFTLPESVINVSYMFSECQQLETIPNTFTLPKNVTNVSAMFMLSGITAIPSGFKLPDTVKNASHMFQLCQMLKAIPENFVIPDSVTDCSSMFATCWQMETIGAGFKIGKKVTNTESMFFQCGNLKNINITIPASVENINKMFYQDAEINRVTGNITLEGKPTQYNQAFYNMGKSNSENLINVYVTDNNLLNALKTTVGEGKVNFSLTT